MLQKQVIRPSEVVAFSMLSQALRGKLLCAIYMPHLNQHPFFYLWSTITPETVDKLCQVAVQSAHFSDSPVFTAGHQADEAYVVMHGSVRYIADLSFFPDAVGEPCKVAVGQWLGEAALWSSWVHTGTAEGVPACEMMSIKVDALMSLVARHVSMAAIVSDYCQCYY